jgi:hypothetical protein
MSGVLATISERNIQEVLHFTTSKGLLGILYTRKVLPRSLLPDEKHVEHIYTPNALTRRDPDWTEYVNLSISRINSRFFNISSQQWHQDEELWWCVLSFSPVILAHEGVLFATTNNMYTGCIRAAGFTGLEALFAESIQQWTGRTVVRRPEMAPFWTTDQQAEVLYPGPLSTDFLQRIYVVTDRHQDLIHAQRAAIQHREVEVVVREDVFE